METIINQFNILSQINMTEIINYLNDKIKTAIDSGSNKFYITNKQFLIDLLTKEGYFIMKDHKDTMRTVTFSGGKSNSTTNIPTHETEHEIIHSSVAYEMLIQKRNQMNELLKEEIIQVILKEPYNTTENMFDVVKVYYSEHDLTREVMWGDYGGIVLNDLMSHITESADNKLTWNYNHNNKFLTITIEKTLLKV